MAGKIRSADRQNSTFIKQLPHTPRRTDWHTNGQ
jgi:hypothetical protein